MSYHPQKPLYYLFKTICYCMYIILESLRIICSRQYVNVCPIILKSLCIICSRQYVNVCPIILKSLCIICSRQYVIVCISSSKAFVLFVQDNMLMYMYYHPQKPLYYLFKTISYCMYIILESLHIICSRQYVNVYVLSSSKAFVLFVQDNMLLYVYHPRKPSYYLFKTICYCMYIILESLRIICSRQYVNVYVLSSSKAFVLFVQDNMLLYVYHPRKPSYYLFKTIC